MLTRFTRRHARAILEDPRSLLLGVLASAAGILLLNPFRATLSVTGSEARWLLAAPGFARDLVDGWIGAVADDRIMRLPAAIVAALAILALFVSLVRRTGPPAALAAALALG